MSVIAGSLSWTWVRIKCLIETGLLREYGEGKELNSCFFVQ